MVENIRLYKEWKDYEDGTESATGFVVEATEDGLVIYRDGGMWGDTNLTEISWTRLKKIIHKMETEE